MSTGAPSERAGAGRARELSRPREFARRTLRGIAPHRGMPLRRRVSMAAALAVAMAVALAVVVCYVSVSYRLHSELNSQLKSEAMVDRTCLEHGTCGFDQLPQYAAANGGSAPYKEVVFSGGAVYLLPGGAALPQSLAKGAIAVASGDRSSSYHDITLSGGTEVCVFTMRLGTLTTTAYAGEGVALELGRPLTQSNQVLHELRLILLVVFLLAVPLAAIFGRFAARRVLRPLAEVTTTAEVIAETDDLSRRIAVREDDEVGQLASRFNAMLERLAASREQLDESVRSQQQLVADASHELRTPVTSLRTNVEVLLASPGLDEDDRALLNDVLEQSEELSSLVADLIEVARGEIRSDDGLDDVRLDRLVAEALVRARRNAPHIEYRESLVPVVVQGNPERLVRAINNLLDNAAKHAGTGPVEVTVNAAGLTVRDHGGGIDPADLPYIFDRFYRGVNSRSTQGSGLGLAIVQQTAVTHGGTASAANAPDGGAIFTLELPTTPPGNARGDTGDDDGGAGYEAGGLATRA